MLKNKRIILASQSPRRRELLAGCDIDFIVADNFNADESYPEELDKFQVSEYISRKKSEAYPVPLKENDILITSDTTVICCQEVLGKPHSREEAIDMISKLSNRDHEVVTGVTIRDLNREVSFSDVSKVHFRELSSEEIEYYVDKYQPYDKAGAYGIQEWIGYVGIDRIEGSYFNIMGLPVEKLYVNLLQFCEEK